MVVVTERYMMLKAILEGRRQECEPIVRGKDIELDPELEQDRCDKLARIERALRMLASGTYGICKGCKKEIEGKRLRALPFIEICIECDAAAELAGAKLHVHKHRDLPLLRAMAGK